VVLGIALCAKLSAERLRHLRHIKALPAGPGKGARTTALAIFVAAEQKERERATP
jgi:hypothetical protein